MEVHHHSPTAVAGHRKKWTQHIWEFLMLFLAVFCGFLAENQREHMVEHQREKQYIKSLSEDLRRDITQIEKSQPRLTQFIARLDSMAVIFYEYKEGGLQLATIKQISLGMGFPDFIYNDRTIQQLKNAGNMRLVRKLNVADSITEYDATVRRGKVHQDLVNEIYMPRIEEGIKHVVNSTLLNELAKEDGAGNIIPAESADILLTHDRKQLIYLVNTLNEYRSCIATQLMFITKDLEEAKVLLALINNEYHLK